MFSTKLHRFWMDKVLCDGYQVALCLHAYVFVSSAPSCIVTGSTYFSAISTRLLHCDRMHEFLCDWYQVVLCLDVCVRSVPSSDVSGVKEHLGCCSGWHCRLGLTTLTTWLIIKQYFNG